LFGLEICLSPANLVGQGCATAARASRFTVTGRGGLPANPLDVQSGDAVWEDVRPGTENLSEGKPTSTIVNHNGQLAVNTPIPNSRCHLPSSEFSQP
jgi:large exoprotein involved in heme utilization and adhesion